MASKAIPFFFNPKGKTMSAQMMNRQVMTIRSWQLLLGNDIVKNQLA
jgi:hypothetical protein